MKNVLRSNDTRVDVGEVRGVESEVDLVQAVVVKRGLDRRRLGRWISQLREQPLQRGPVTLLEALFGGRSSVDEGSMMGSAAKKEKGRSAKGEVLL